MMRDPQDSSVIFVDFIVILFHALTHVPFSYWWRVGSCHPLCDLPLHTNMQIPTNICCLQSEETRLKILVLMWSFERSQDEYQMLVGDCKKNITVVTLCVWVGGRVGDQDVNTGEAGFISA